MSINIRPWRLDDLEVVRYILWETWKDSYSNIIPRDDLLTYFEENYTIQKLEEQFNDTRVFGFVAECDGVITGYEKTYYSEQENRLYVHQLYVLPIYQNLGFGKKLIKLAAKLAKSIGLEKIWIGVMVKNLSSVEWYKNMGYEVVENAPFAMGKTTVEHYIGFIPVGNILTEDKS